MASRICELYAELFTINTTIYSDSDDNIKGDISRVTEKNETGVTRIFNTFKALCNLADFDNITEIIETSQAEEDNTENISTMPPQPLPRATDFN